MKAFLVKDLSDEFLIETKKCSPIGNLARHGLERKILLAWLN
jgi:hypothetical protein